MDYFDIGLAIVNAAVGTVRTVKWWLRGQQAAHWPTGGQIAGSYPEGDLKEVYYSYQVGGSYYSGCFWKNRFNRKNLETLKGRQVLVRYKPDRPEISFLLDSD